jgi:UDP-N-acetylmuramate--alanine ligase
LSMADETILLPIYPARELPMEGVTSELIASKMEKNKVKMLEKDGLLKYLQSSQVPPKEEFREALIITAGAGDIDALVQPIKNLFL